MTGVCWSGFLVAALLAIVVTAAVWLLPTSLAAAVAVILVLGATRVGRRRATDPRTVADAISQDSEASEPEFAELVGALDSLAEGVMFLDDELRVVAANDAASRFAGQSRDEMRGLPLVRVAREYDLIEAARLAPAATTRETRLSNGTEVRITAAPIAIGTATTMLVMEEVGPLRRAERARTDLVANLSHELRTPLAAVRALAETARDSVDDPEEHRQFLDRLVEEVERLGDMVQGMLRLARLDAGAEPFTSEPLEPLVLLEAARDRIAPVASRKRVTVELGDVGDVGTVCGDRGRVLEVLSNLLDNAVRHSPQGGRVSLAALPDDQQIRFEVRDEGSGVLPHERTRVFERFYTGDASRGSEGGTGIGLAIAKQIVERQGGRIWVADRSPGATFCFTLPASTSRSN